MDRSIAEAIASAPFYANQTAEEIAELAAGLKLRRFADGEALMVQGADSDGAFLITSGAVAVGARLPGGGEASIADLGPGDVVGEMALLMRGGRRTASARARGDVEALFIDRRYFEASLHLLRPASLKILRSLGMTIADRLRAIRRRGRALVETAAKEGQLRIPPGGGDDAPAPFDVRAFLPILPCLREFSPDEIDVLFGAARVEQVPRGAVLVEEGGMIGAPRLVVRGALVMGQRHGKRLHQLDILGPGRFAGVAPVLEASPAASAILATEASTLLAFNSARFIALWNGQDRLSLKLLEAVNADLIQSLNTAGNHLTRLTAEARVRVLEAS